MKKIAGLILLGVFFLSTRAVFSQSSDGVLVSPPVQGQSSDQGNNDNSVLDDNGSNINSPANPSKSVQYKHNHASIVSNAPSQGANSLPTDEIVVKATKGIVFQMTTNLKLTPDQINTVTPIIADSVAAIRNLQQSLENGDIDSATMLSQRKQLTDDENQELSSFLTSDQMKIWLDMQNQSAPKNKQSSTK